MSGLALTIPLAIVVLIAAWRWPYEALGFVVTGSIPYYSVLHVTNAETSSEITGLVFGAAGVAAMGRLLTLKGRASLVFSSPYVILYAVFAGVWYLRWYLEPPSGASFEMRAGFADRAQVYMLVFSAVPFLGGMAIRSREELMRTFRAMAWCGGVGSLILLAYWISGAPNLGPGWSAKWEPIRSLTGIILSFDLGAGLLAYLLVSDGLSNRVLRLFRWVPVAIVISELVRVGQRGPFVFLIVALLAYLGIGTRRAVIRVGLSMAVLIGVVAFVSLEIGDSYHATRAITAQNYTSEENGNRLAILQAAVGFIAERPIEGWGGSLIGQPVGFAESDLGTWSYSHMMLLDPVLETGLLGALPFWAMYLLATSRFVRLWRSMTSADFALKAILVFFVYTMLESQVMGHVSSSKHAWLATGMFCGVTEWMLRAIPGTTAAKERVMSSLSTRRGAASAPLSRRPGPAFGRALRKP